MNLHSLPASVLGVAVSFGFLCAAEPSSQSSEEKTVRLTSIEKHCQKMLLMQIVVNQDTTALHTAIQANPDKKPGPKDKEVAAQLSVKEKAIVDEANAVLNLLNKDGTAVAFTEVFEELRGQIKRVHANLEKCEVGPATQKLQTNIAETLKEMLGVIRTPR
jgi:hypothetical protein